MSLTYKIEKQNGKWMIFRLHDDGSRTSVGHAEKRKSALMIASVLAGWQGRVVR